MTAFKASIEYDISILQQQVRAHSHRITAIEEISTLNQKQLAILNDKISDIETVIGFWVFDKSWKTRMIKLLSESFNQDELDSLLIELFVNPEEIERDAITIRCQKIVSYFDRRKENDKLLNACMKLRPKIHWPMPRDNE